MSRAYPMRPVLAKRLSGGASAKAVSKAGAVGVCPALKIQLIAKSTDAGDVLMN